MARLLPARLVAVSAALALGACSHGSSDPLVGFGPKPALPAPAKSLFPVFGVPNVIGWAPGAAPKAPPGFLVTRFAEGMDHPRWLYVLPNGDVLVAESATEANPADQKGLRGWFARRLLTAVGAMKHSPNKIILLRDADGDGRAETRTVFGQGVKRPFGMTLVGDGLYVAGDDALVRFAYQPGPDGGLRAAGEAAGPAGRPDQPPLDEEHRGQP